MITSRTFHDSVRRPRPTIVVLAAGIVWALCLPFDAGAQGPRSRAEMISAGASLVQVYTGLIYEGPAIARNINEGLRRIVSSQGFVSLDEAVGCRAMELAGELAG